MIPTATRTLSIPVWVSTAARQNHAHVRAVAWLALHGADIATLTTGTARCGRADEAVTDWLIGHDWHDLRAAVAYADELRRDLAGTAGSYLLIVSAPKRAVAA